MSDWGLITELSATMWALAEARFKLQIGASKARRVNDKLAANPRVHDYGCALMSPRPVRGCRPCLPGNSLKVRGRTRMSSSEKVRRLRLFSAYSVTYSGL